MVEQLEFNSGGNYSNLNLEGAILDGRHLEGINLSGANMHGVNILRTNLSQAKLAKANLEQATLVEADLTGANLQEANLYKVALTQSKLERANLSYTYLRLALLNEVNLSGASLRHAVLRDVKFSHVNLRRADLTGADLTGADLTGADLTGADLTGAILKNTKKNTNLSKSVLDTSFSESKSFQQSPNQLQTVKSNTSRSKSYSLLLEERHAEEILLELFTELQGAGLSVGIGEYFLLIQALKNGFGTNRETLADLCKTLWVKSPEDEYLFDFYYKKIISGTSITESFSSRSNKPTSTHSLVSNDEVSREKHSGTDNQTEKTNPTTVSTALIDIEDEVQVAEAVQVGTRQDNEIEFNQFTQNDEYFPVTRRQMKQRWRYLRRQVREGLLTELDLEATINLIVQQGILLEPVMVPRRINQTELLLLLDHKGSMVPFHALSQRLTETAQQEGRLRATKVYYFHNCPTGFLYRDPNRQQAESLPDVLTQLKPERSVVLIFSDAGAARGGYSEERLDLTQQFLNQLKQNVRRVVWLNPMPQDRWIGTTAEETAELIPMFDVSRQGLEQAIYILQGKMTRIGEWVR